MADTLERLEEANRIARVARDKFREAAQAANRAEWAWKDADDAANRIWRQYIAEREAALISHDAQTADKRR